MSVSIKKFECIIDDGSNVFKEIIPAVNKKDLMARWGNNGDFVRVKEIPDFLPSAEAVRSVLKDGGLSEAECDFVYRVLVQYVEGTE